MLECNYTNKKGEIDMRIYKNDMTTEQLDDIIKTMLDYVGRTVQKSLIERLAEEYDYELIDIRGELHRIDLQEEDMNTDFMSYKGVFFNHYESDEFGAWVYMCEECLGENEQLMSYVGGEDGAVCSVSGCFNHVDEGHTTRAVDIELGVGRVKRVEKSQVDALMYSHNFSREDAEDVLNLIKKQERLTEKLTRRQLEEYNVIQAYEDYGIRWADANELLRYVNEGDSEDGFGIAELWDSDYHFPLRSGVWISWRW